MLNISPNLPYNEVTFEYWLQTMIKTGAAAIQCCSRHAFAKSAFFLGSVTIMNFQHWVFPDDGANLAWSSIFAITSIGTSFSWNFLMLYLDSIASFSSIQYF